MAELVVNMPSGRSENHRLRQAPMIIGRERSCELYVDDPSISRQHARFRAESDGYVVEDLGSKNGILVNDEPCSTRRLQDGDQILIGSTNVVFKDSDVTFGQSSVVVQDDKPTTNATRYVSRDKQLHLSQQRLKMIYELSERLTTLKDERDLLDDALDICIDMLGFERCAIGVRRPGERGLDWPVVRDLYGSEGELKISRTLLNRALEHGERAIFTEADAATVDPTVSMVQHGIRSAMCVPLLHGEETMGVIYGDRVRSSVVYSDEDIDFLAGIARQVTIGLINGRLLDEQRRMELLKRDVELARKIQTGLLPAKLPARDDLKIAAINDPGQRVSGDYYDVIELDDGRVWCVMADVTGEGVAAALLMANLQAAVRVTINDNDESKPEELLSRWNKLIDQNTDSSKFVTCLLMLFDPKARTIQYASAGHFGPVVLRANGTKPTELAVEAGFPLGVVASAEFTTASYSFGPEPAVVFTYTDGVTEAMSAEGAMFGSDQLMTLLGESSELNPQAIVKRVRKRLTSFAAGATHGDDITMLAVKVG